LPQEDSIFFRILSSRQLEVTEEGKLVQKDRADSVAAREALRKQHKRNNRMRNRISLDEFMGDTGGSFG
tara:strand:+ start:1200 stop:1406 length:207 start_codon:yes stop_codon:yes gene_type:complete